MVDEMLTFPGLSVGSVFPAHVRTPVSCCLHKGLFQGEASVYLLGASSGLEEMRWWLRTTAWPSGILLFLTAEQVLVENSVYRNEERVLASLHFMTFVDSRDKMKSQVWET